MNEKDILRNKLFDKYFEVEDGILLEDFVKVIAPINETWDELHKILLNNVKCYDPFCTIQSIKEIVKNNSKYLIIKIRMGNYIIIDLDVNKLVTKEEVENIFDELFFIDNFEEMKFTLCDSFTKIYYFVDEIKNINEVVEFYLNNKEVLNMSYDIYYKINLGEAWTYIYINFIGRNSQLGFQTRNQFLYEQLFLNPDLTPSGMQDAVQKIGKERMQEMFSQIKKIRIPLYCIPEDLYQKYVSLKENDQTLSRKKKDE